MKLGHRSSTSFASSSYVYILNTSMDPSSYAFLASYKKFRIKSIGCPYNQTIKFILKCESNLFHMHDHIFAE